MKPTYYTPNITRTANALFGLWKRVNVYDALSLGAKEGLDTLLGILPNLVGLMTAVYMLRASGLMEVLGAGCPLKPTYYTPNITRTANAAAIYPVRSAASAAGIAYRVFRAGRTAGPRAGEAGHSAGDGGHAVYPPRQRQRLLTPAEPK